MALTCIYVLLHKKKTIINRTADGEEKKLLFICEVKEYAQTCA